jgi:murein tripeptide amidase MpaA
LSLVGANIRYHDLEDIYPWLESIPSLHPNLASRFVVGKSVLNRDMVGIKISNGVGNGKKPALWLDAGIHAREWITPAVMLWIIDEILTNYETDNEIRNMLNGVDLYILPVFNVDGYEYTWNFQRTWRKNRRINSKLPWFHFHGKAIAAHTLPF